MRIPSQQKGYLAEVAFEKKLIELGYGPVCSPARVDEGVDFVVWTEKGWLGIQVKFHSGHIRRVNRGPDVSRKKLRLSRGRKSSSVPPREHYISKGVDVFAIHFEGGFYLVPIDDFQGNEISLGKVRHRWEAWGEVFGIPTESSVVTEEEPPASNQLILLEKQVG